MFRTLFYVLAGAFCASVVGGLIVALFPYILALIR